MYLATFKEFRGFVTWGVMSYLGWGPGHPTSDCRPPSRMELQDFLCHFATIQVCSLSPEVLVRSPAGGGRYIHTFQGRWVRGFNSGRGQPRASEAWRVP